MSFIHNKNNNYNFKHSYSEEKNRAILDNHIKKLYFPKFNNKTNIKRIQTPHKSIKSSTTNAPSDKENTNSSQHLYHSQKGIQSEENIFDDFFNKKNKKLFEARKISNNKKITFQRKKDKNILEFDLLDDNLIFKDINKAFLQDQDFDDGSDSSDKQVELGSNLLNTELLKASKKINKFFSNNKEITILSRKIRFKIHGKNN